MIADFHFLRPWWLMALLVPVAIFWLASRSGDARNKWKGMIAPHLLDRLVVDAKGRSRIRPVWLLALLLTVAILAAAGPTWQRQAPPFVEDTAVLVIAVDLSATMDAIDITPSRLERAKLKIRDIVAGRSGARTAIIAYAGSAHLVLPLTDDASLLETYSDALATRIMPKQGKDTAAAVKLAGDILKQDGTTGTILFLTDGIEQSAFQSLKSTTNGIVVLGIGTSVGGPVKTPKGGLISDDAGQRMSARLDVSALKNLRSVGVDVATVTDDDTDVRWINQQIRTNFAQKSATDGDRWRDAGWWLLFPAILFFALSFRKGWVVKIGMLLLALHAIFPPVAEASELKDMWLTRDQQGRLAFQYGDIAQAASLFSDPMWKGVSLYRIGKFAEAVDAFAAVDSPESWYDQGNALLHLSKFDDAIAAYTNALARRKDWPEAEANLAIARRLLQAKKDEQDDQQEPNEKPDQVQFDDRGKQGKAGKIDIAEQTSEVWMKSINVSPADLMARKFSLEAKEAKP